MRRQSTPVLSSALLLVFAVALVGCDQTPNSPEDFRVQGTMDSPAALTLTPDLAPEFTVEYQGLESVPSIDAPSRIGVEMVGEPQGNPSETGSATWRLSLDGEVENLLEQDNVLIRGSTVGGREVVDTLAASVTTSLTVQAEFTSSFYTFADYEGDVTIDNYGLEEDFTPSPEEFESEPYENSPEGSNGIRFLEIDATSGGAVSIERQMNLPNSDFFSFLIRPASSLFTLTITMTEETGGGEVRRELELPIPPGDDWLKVGIPFGLFGEDFNPVDSRSGGNGPLISVRLSADADVEYAVDEMLFGIGPTEGESFKARAELHDFEETNLAFGPPFSPNNTFGFSTVGDEDFMVANESDGITARSIGPDAPNFGYDTGGGGFDTGTTFVMVDVDGDDVLSFLVKDTEGGGEIDASLSADGFSGSVTVGPFPQGEWERVEIPIQEFGDPAAALDPGISGSFFGLNVDGEIFVDDIKIMPK